MSRYVNDGRGAGSRGGQILRHESDRKRWQVKAFIGRDANGKKRYLTQVVHGGKRDAEAVLLEMLQRKSTGRLTPRSIMLVRDLIGEWSKHKAREVAPRTLAQYVRGLERYVL